MKLYSIEHRAYRVTWFLTVQLIALIGWIIVQSFFSLSPLGQNLGFTPTIVVEAIWWIATLVIMFVLFKREYNSFVKAALDLEQADKKLRETTNNILSDLRNQREQEK
jgi:magnesium-transporting ATPase (P-type)